MTRGDLQAWTNLLAENAGFGPWPIERSLPLFGPDSPVVFDGSYFLTRDGEPVATAQLHHQSRRPYAPTAELGWVAVSPRFQGRGLGYVVCLAVLRYAAKADYPAIFLRTEDHRLPAIRTYLKLGFEPWMVDPTATERWRVIEGQLAEFRRRSQREAR
jgi:mycothiol synthase